MPARLLCFLILLPLCFWLSGCTPTAEGQSDEQLNAHYLAGKEKLGAFDYKGAIDSFERALEDNPRSPLTHFELAVLYEQQEHDYAAALYHYSKALKFRPNAYPADNARQRIPACRQELVKADSLATINPTLLNEIQTLRATNQWLQKELDLARLQIAGRNGQLSPTDPFAPATQPSRSSSSLGPGSSSGWSPSSSRTPPPAGARIGSDSTRPPSSVSRVRTYAIKSGDTLASVARQHGIRLEALLAGNPGLNPKRLKVGQVVNIPAT
jgi:hypothetical protein